MYECSQNTGMCTCQLLTKIYIGLISLSLCSIVWMLNPDKTNRVQHKHSVKHLLLHQQVKLKKQADVGSPSDPELTQAYSVLGPPARHLSLHNPKADELIENQKRPGSLHIQWGLASLRQFSRIIWKGSVGVLRAQSWFVMAWHEKQ